MNKQTIYYYNVFFNIKILTKNVLPALVEIDNLIMDEAIPLFFVQLQLNLGMLTISWSNYCNGEAEIM